MELKKEFIQEDDTIFQIITKHPILKETLKNLSPSFAKLDNPLIFNTVARTTTIKKASQIGKIYLKEMLYQLNDAIGMGKEYLYFTKSELNQKKNEFLENLSSNSTQNEKPPVWIDESSKFEALDVRNSNEDPFSKIIEKANEKKPGNGFILIQKFEPIPLISYLESLGFEHFTRKVSSNEFHIIFYKKN